jgi:DNA-binding MarR family transcriptional regulator
MMAHAADRVAVGDGYPVTALVWALDPWAEDYVRTMRRDLADLPVHGAEWRLLATLHVAGALHGSALAARLGISRAAASIVAKRLAARHLITGRTDRRDRRRRLFTLTAAGQALVESVEWRRAARLGSGWARLSPEEQATFLAVLTRLREEAHGRAGAAPATDARPGYPVRPR